MINIVTWAEVEPFTVVVPNDPVATLGCCGIVGAATLNAQQVGRYKHMLLVGDKADGEKMSNTIHELIGAELNAEKRAMTFHESTLSPDMLDGKTPVKTPTSEF